MHGLQNAFLPTSPLTRLTSIIHELMEIQMPGETFQAVISPPADWPVKEVTRLTQGIPSYYGEVFLEFLPTGQIRFRYNEHGKPSQVLDTCKLTFSGSGVIVVACRIGSDDPNLPNAAYLNQELVAYNSKEKEVPASIEIELRDPSQIKPAPDDGVVIDNPE